MAPLTKMGIATILATMALAAPALPDIDISAITDAPVFTGTLALIEYQPAVSTSTILATDMVTVYQCPPDVVDCPARKSTAYVTQTTVMSTTICPLTLSRTRLTTYTTPATQSQMVPTAFSQLFSSSGEVVPSFSYAPMTSEGSSIAASEPVTSMPTLTSTLSGTVVVESMSVVSTETAAPSISATVSMDIASLLPVLSDLPSPAGSGSALPSTSSPIAENSVVSSPALASASATVVAVTSTVQVGPSEASISAKPPKELTSDKTQSASIAGTPSSVASAGTSPSVAASASLTTSSEAVSTQSRNSRSEISSANIESTIVPGTSIVGSTSAPSATSVKSGTEVVSTSIDGPSDASSLASSTMSVMGTIYYTHASTITVPGQTGTASSGATESSPTALTSESSDVAVTASGAPYTYVPATASNITTAVVPYTGVGVTGRGLEWSWSAIMVMAMSLFNTI